RLGPGWSGRNGEGMTTCITDNAVTEDDEGFTQPRRPRRRRRAALHAGRRATSRTVAAPPQPLTSGAESGNGRAHAMPAPLLCLFDIDGTLLQVAEEVAFAQAFQHHCGPSVDVSFSPGLLVSDSAYIHDVLTRSYGRPATAAERAALIARF